MKIIVIFIFSILLSSEYSYPQEDLKIQNEIDFKKDNDTLYFNKDDDYYLYISSEYKKIKENKIKFIKIENIRQEYYNLDGELTRIEYIDSQGEIWGWLDFYKFYNNYFYKLYNVFDDYQTNYYSEVDGEFFVLRDWPHKQTIFYSKALFDEGKLYAMYGYGDPYIYLDLYSYRSDGLIHKVLRYLIENLEPESKDSFKDLPKLLFIEEYKYNSDFKLIEVETKDVVREVISSIKLKYNERGLVEENEKGEILKYEYY